MRTAAGHDLRYEIDPARAEAAFDWVARHDFETGLGKTIDWYLGHRPWWERIRAGRYGGERLGTAKDGQPHQEKKH